MVARYPGARWIPSGTDQGPNNGPNAFSWHEAVTTASSVAGWVETTNSCHGFIAKDGTAEQYKDFDRVAYGTLNGNQRGVVTWETWDDLLPSTNRSPDNSHGPNDFPWSPEQCERIADIIAWASTALNIPIHFMADTRERGHAPHRLGVPNPSGAVYVGFGQDTWTSHPGKQCPGDMRILQLRDKILPRARQLVGSTPLPAGPVNLATALARAGGGTPPPPVETDWFDMATKEELKAVVTQCINDPAFLNAVAVTVLQHGLTTEEGINVILPSLPQRVWEYAIENQVPDENGHTGKYMTQSFLASIDRKVTPPKA